MRAKTKALWVGAGFTLFLLMSGCSLVHGPAKVSDEGFARVPPEQLAEVGNLRAREAMAADELGRREVAIHAAKNEVDSAKQELKAAEALLGQAQAALEQAEYDRNTAGAEQATRNQQVASARKQAAEAWIRAAEAQKDYAEAQKDSVEAERELVRAQIEIAKFDALQRTGDPEIKNVKASDLYSRKEKAQQALEDAKQKTAALAIKAEVTRTAWHEDNDRYRSMQGIGGGEAQ